MKPVLVAIIAINFISICSNCNQDNRLILFSHYLLPRKLPSSYILILIMMEYILLVLKSGINHLLRFMLSKIVIESLRTKAFILENLSFFKENNTFTTKLMSKALEVLNYLP